MAPIAEGAYLCAIVPTMNRLDDMLEFAGTLVAQTVPIHELFVVDAGAPSALEARLGALLKAHGVALTYRTSSPGTSLQRNVALDLLEQRLAQQGPGRHIVFFFDDDVLLEPDYVQQSLAVMALPLSPPVGCVLATFTSPARPRGWQQQWFRLFGMTHSVLGDEAGMDSGGGVRWLIEPSRDVPVPVASGGRTAYRAEAIHGERFDEFLPGYTLNEDVEFSFRVAHNWTIVQSPAVRLFHKRSPNARVNYGDRVSRIIYSRYYFFQKHLPADARHLAAFAWSNVGIAGFYTAVGIARAPRGEKLDVLKGIARGYRRCARHLRGRDLE